MGLKDRLVVDVERHAVFVVDELSHALDVLGIELLALVHTCDYSVDMDRISFEETLDITDRIEFRGLDPDIVAVFCKIVEKTGYAESDTLLETQAQREGESLIFKILVVCRPENDLVKIYGNSFVVL